MSETYELIEVRDRQTGAVLRTRADWIDPARHERLDGEPSPAPIEPPALQDLQAITAPAAVEVIRAADRATVDAYHAQEMGGKGRRGVLNAIDQRLLELAVAERDTDAPEGQP